MDVVWDCIIVGGGAAGLSAGLVLGRARRRTLLVAAGAQSNLPAHGIGGLLGRDGGKPAVLYETGRRELSAYPSVDVHSGEVVTGERVGDEFVLHLADGGRERTRRVLLATGMDYRPPSLPGLAELWDRAVFHCPFCHGWETPVAENPVAVDGFYRTAARGVFAAGDLSAQMPQVAAAIAGGSQAAAAVVQSLVADEYGLSVPEGRRHVNA